MQPFVAADAGAYGPLISSIPDPLKRIQEQLAFKSGLEAQQAETAFKRAQIEAAAVKQRRTEQAQAAVQAALSNPTAENISGLMMQYPEIAEELKKAWDLKDEAARAADFGALSEMWSAVENGRPDLAASIARQRYEADKAAGRADETDLAIVEMLESGDPAKIAQAKGLIGMGIKSSGGAEHFGSVSGALDPKLEATDGIVWDERTGEVKGQLPGAGIRTVEGVGIFNVDIPGVPTLGGGSATGTVQSGSPPAAVPSTPEEAVQTGRSTVVSVFSGAGIPTPVIAGALGNFDVEGGWTGAVGDGGKARGIAQWHPDRLANYERAVGKPFSPTDYEGQARFFLWEMQNPEKAGMTVAQRDAILNAKTPEQAAMLIDRHYERSSGKHRRQRVEMARRHAQALGSGGYYGAGGTAPQATAVLNGQTYYKIGGQWFDNPEGN